ncbi:MAG: HAMP domain-containing protein [Deltaproteobacteria bacterium]|nr:HAMP domain-containing protein [Deltaproteobacteria bacterium]
MRQLRPSLTVSILAFLSCLLLMAWLLFSLFAFRTAANDLYAQKGDHARMLLATFISQLPDVIPAYPDGMIPSASPAAVYAQKLAEDASFIRLTLLDAGGKVIFTAGRENGDIYQPFAGLEEVAKGSYVLPDGAGIVCVAPVTRSGAVAAKAGLALSLSAEKERLNRSRQLYLAYFAIDFILLLGFGAFILSRIVVAPVSRLLTATERITGGQYGQRVRVSGSAELARLAVAFNEMSDALLEKDRQVTAQMTALEQANTELRLAREEALRSEKMASIGLLAAGMAHEIGTPLASIMGYAELLAGEQTGHAAIQDYTRRITQDCARIDRIVRGLLDYSRPRASAVEAADIPQLVRDSAGLLIQQGAFKGIKVSTWFEDALPQALVDPHQLQQVLINLMLNSRDAMPCGGRVAIRGVRDSSAALTGPSAGYVCLEVLDNGCGIPEEHIKSIFEPFFTTKEPGKGTGLGLAISARIIEGVGGRITVRSAPGKGSCFTLWLPAAASG